MIRLPDFEAWAIFAKVAEHGSFSRAAAELALSKATVSKALTRLEARLGTPLFHRSSRRLSLTESGRASLDRARRILAEGEAVEDAALDRPREPRGLVKLAAPVSFGIQYLGTILPAFLERHPHVSVDLRLSDKRTDLVGEGIDIALRIGVLEDSALRARQLYAIRMLLVAAPAYLARRGIPAHPRDLEQHTALIFTHLASPQNWQFHHPLESPCAVRVDGRLHIDNGDVAMPALLAGTALAIMPEFLVWQALRSGALVEVLPEWTAGLAALHIVAPGSLRPARVAALIAFLVQHFKHAPWAYAMPDAAAGQAGAADQPPPSAR